ncbi:borealin [Danio rerio]|uniref:Borealin n=2 Tax=Danio rerio TaxID=7955 RepID=BORE1_DANRE|nr:borealin [Danio rerio]Q5XLR4.2 RecName: Full=Borealin; AltName: Full=Cell division cycle-associated protein 8; AltName: Full=Dasra-B; Short=DasraB; Short=DrDasraB [Danio rerio]AAH85383.1 Cell division cycle associated 8 [Danio rerio]AAI64626.1 Cdca8 protein [Danio rerio]|eukprot:NP_001007457.1 borealin [Danio rerio]
MAPRKRTQNAKSKKNPKAPKLEAFLLDFDDEVHTIVERLKEKTNNLLKDADNLYKTALIKLPMAVRKMNWIEYCNLEKPKSPVDDSKVREEAAQVELAIAGNHTIPKVAAKEAKSSANSEDENMAPLKSTMKKKKASKKAPSTSKKPRTLSISKQGGTIQRTTRKPLITPARSFLDSSIIGATPLITPRFDPRLPKTPALRSALHREKVYSMSVNGSPLSAGGEDIVISVPIGNGECIQLLASEMDSVDLSQLDEKALRSIRNLQNRLTTLCGSSK